jgi:hypothetical protein
MGFKPTKKTAVTAPIANSQSYMMFLKVAAKLSETSLLLAFQTFFW